MSTFEQPAPITGRKPAGRPRGRSEYLTIAIDATVKQLLEQSAARRGLHRTVRARVILSETLIAEAAAEAARARR